jgi:putative inorganic carbon (HCO3(-)) transporter
MESSSALLIRAALWCSAGALVADFISIAVSQTLLGIALALMLLSGVKLRFPPIGWPLGLFLSGTLLSLVLSQYPSEGHSQIRKFYIFAILLVIVTMVRQVSEVRRMFLAIIGLSALSATRGLFQYWKKWNAAQETGQDFTQAYIADRITGFMSHWMTFGGEMLIALMLALAYLMFAERRRWSIGVPGLLLLLAIVLGWTRGIYLGVAAGALYLVWEWNKKMVLALPVLGALVFAVSPPSLQNRLLSIVRPRGTMDSNEHRRVTWTTGMEMIKAHPVFGGGPEHPKLHFKEYVPASIPKPLPEGWYEHLHNIYLQIAAERGIPALLIFFWWIGKMIYDFRRRLAQLGPGADDRRFILHAAIAVVIGTLVTGIFENNLFDSEVLMGFLGVCACAYVPVLEDVHPANEATHHIALENV